MGNYFGSLVELIKQPVVVGSPSRPRFTNSRDELISCVRALHSDSLGQTTSLTFVNAWLRYCTLHCTVQYSAGDSAAPCCALLFALGGRD